jgi:hypothetical protein
VDVPDPDELDRRLQETIEWWQNWSDQGRLDEARQTFQRALAVGNDLGLFAEEFDPTADEILDNFPQGLTHLSLITASVALNEFEGAVKINSGDCQSEFLKTISKTSVNERYRRETRQPPTGRIRQSRK